MTDPRIVAVAESLSTVYPGEPRRLYQSVEHAHFADWTVSRSDARLDWIVGGLRAAGVEPATGPVLDIGCLTGRIDRHLARAGWAVHGVDGYERVVTVARTLADVFALAALVTYECRTADVSLVESRRWSAVVCPSTFHPALASGRTADVAAIWRACLRQSGALVIDDAWPGDAGPPPWLGPQWDFVTWLGLLLGSVWPGAIRALGTSEGRTLYLVRL